MCPVFTFTTFCPHCLKDGVEKRLSYQIGEDEVFCGAGHKFPCIEDAIELLSSVGAPEAAVEPSQEAAEALVVDALDQAEKEYTESLHMDALPAPIELPAPVVEPIIEKKETKMSTTQKPAETKVAPAPKPAAKVPPTVARAMEKLNGKVHSPVKIEGGAMLVTLRIDDPWVSGVEQEAANQEMTVQEHLQNVFTYGIQQGWFCILVLGVSILLCPN